MAVHSGRLNRSVAVMRNFFDRPGARWSQHGRLHVYYLPPEAWRDRVRRYHEVLDGLDAEHNLGLQPPEWSHATVQMLRRHVDEVDAVSMVRLVDTLRAHLGAVPTFSLRIGPPAASRRAVEAWIDPTADADWHHLVETTRTAVTEALGEDTLPEEGYTPNYTPHTSLGYGVGDGDSGVLTSALKRVRLPPVEAAVEAVHLVAVHQHADEGFYDWSHIAEIPLKNGA